MRGIVRPELDMPRGELKTMLGLGDRMATDALGALVC